MGLAKAHWWQSRDQSEEIALAVCTTWWFCEGQLQATSAESIGESYISSKPGTRADSNNLIPSLLAVSFENGLVVFIPKEESKRSQRCEILRANASQQGAAPDEISNSDDFASMEILQASTSEERAGQVAEIEHLGRILLELALTFAEHRFLTETHQEYSWPTRCRSSRRPYVAAAPSPDWESLVSEVLSFGYSRRSLPCQHIEGHRPMQREV